LHDAAAGGFIEVVKVLLAAGADVNARNQRGRTPLDHVTHMMRNRAFRKKLEPCAELLREHIAKQNQ
jgi:ankyrin repeat protein